MNGFVRFDILEKKLIPCANIFQPLSWFLKNMFTVNRRRIAVFVAIIIALIVILYYAIELSRNTENLSVFYDPDWDPKTPVLVTVYYEALCPDSKHFIIDQLVPTYRKLTPFMDISLVPYGKAATHPSMNGSYRFDCQHGTTECQANIYHACVIDIVKEIQRRLDIIACMINNNHSPRDAFYRCMQEDDRESIDLVEKCYDNTHGRELLKLHGDATNALQPPVAFIPTVTLDGVQGRQSNVLKDLTQEICKMIKSNLSAAEICKMHFS